ncbi:MAG: DUF2064 domain-containing protein [Flavobacteriaceae bacterium]
MQEHCKIGRTAILIFANSSKEELKYKNIPKGKIVFEGLTEHALNTAKKTGLPYFLLSEKEQSGSCFGERFVNAICSIFVKDFDNIITIGNDTPQIKSSDIIQASRLVQAKKSVLGPSMDGGFYLMALHKSQFNPKAFKKLPWRENTLFKKISALIEAASADIIRLRVLADLDTKSDLKRILKGLEYRPEKIFKLILSLVVPVIKIMVQAFIPLSFKFKSVYFNKGSPSYFIHYTF